tara:strand:+ start:11436 stop:11651 length:216 start_codon:yes stop_codon:yes gene_type:complete
MESKNKKVVKINEDNLVDLICKIVDKRVAEELSKAKPSLSEGKTKKITVTESQLRELQAKGVKINSIVKKK